jgi:glycosyltransferase involved in cell wall biosynthesis
MHCREIFPAILFLDQSGELGGAELCLADIAEFSGERSAALLFQDGPFAELLRARNIAVHIVTLPKMAVRVDKAASLFAYLPATLGMVMLIFRGLRIAKDFDLLYANTAKALIVGAVLAFVLRKKFCFHLHDILSADHFSAINRCLIVSLANRAEAVVANSLATAEAFQSNGGRKDLVRVIPNGFEISRFRTTLRKRSCELPGGVPPGDFPLVGLFGRITRWKGQDVLIKALADLPGVHGLIVGEALFTAEDGAFRAEISNLATDLGVADRIHFVGFCRDIVPLLFRVDLVVHCSTLPEPFGRVIVEAMLAGRPVVAAKAGGALEIVKDHETGLLVEPSDSHALAGAIHQLLGNPRLATTLSESAKRDAEERFGLEGVLQQWKQCIREVMHPKQRYAWQSSTIT